MNTFPSPRPFQEAAHQSLRDGVRNGHRHQVIMAATGAGKTYLAMRVINEALARGRSAIFVADRVTLINQTSETAFRYGLPDHGIIQANHPRTNRRLPFQIASVQTLMRRSWPDADVIVIDECHTLYKGWTDHIQNCRGIVVGLSATPFTKGMGKLFTNLINAATMDHLTREGVLVPMRVFSCHKPDMEGAETAGGEWTDRAAEERELRIVGDVVVEWCQFAYGLKTIVFGSTIKHCEELARQFNSVGAMAACFTAQTTPEERDQLLREYRKPDSRLRVLVSVEALAKGFDVPDVECVCDCRPLRKSLSTAIQMWGRGLRSHPGKEECRLLDFSGNIVRFAADFSDIYYNGLDSLDVGEKLDREVRKDKQEEPDGKKCPVCGHQPYARKCVACGHEAQSQSLIEHEPGTMKEIMIGGAIAAGSRIDLWRQLCTYTNSHGNPDTANGRAWHLFRQITGSKPPRNYPRAEHCQSATVSTATINKIKSLNIAYAKRRAA